MLLLKPYLKCPNNCAYCYETEYRKNKNPKKDYNLEAVFERMDEFKHLNMMSLHGGEPLLLPMEDLEKIFGKMKELIGKTSIQTSGVFIDEEKIELFKKYNTSVGISYDGPEELSEYRPASQKARVDEKIERLRKEGINVSTIIVISKANTGTNERLEKLKNYILRLNEMRIYGRLNPCIAAPKECELTLERNKEVYLDLAEFCLKHNLTEKWSPFIDITNALLGNPRVCNFMGCDPFHTQSATVILGDGSVTNCMRLNKKGILLRYPAEINLRTKILEETPYEFGGCQGCKYWEKCYGGCTDSGIDGDWRNRTYLCGLWKTLFQFYENKLGFIFNHLSRPPQSAFCQPQTAISKEKNVQKAINFDDKNSRVSRNKNDDKEHSDISHGDWEDHGDAGHGDWPDHGDGIQNEDSDHGNGFIEPDKKREHGDWEDHGDN